MFYARWHEDGSATVLARITARNGTGGSTGVAGEGNWLKQADIDNINIKVFDLDADNPDTATVDTDLTISEVVQDTPVTSTALWTKDTTGYNFIHDLPSTYFPEGNRRYRVEYEVTLNGGSVVFHGILEGSTTSLRGS